MRDSFRIALAQMRVVPGGKETNLLRAESCIEESGQAGAACIVLPEMLDTGWTHPSALTEAGLIPNGDACRRLARAARRAGLYVCAGLSERCGNRVYNTAVLLGPDGGLRLRHRKLNELEMGHALYAQGDRLAVCETDLGTLGVMICADAFARGEVVSRTLGYMGAQVILSPSAWAVPADHDQKANPYGALWRNVYGPVAKDFQLWIVGVSNVGDLTAGPWSGRKCIGCSLVVGPDGAPVVQGPYGTEAEALLYAELRPVPRPARGDGWARLWQCGAPKGTEP